jgi:pimeloyl-ACP methyl ester carboxylesterase
MFVLIRATTVALALCFATDAVAAKERIDEEMFVPIGGIPQWVTIKGADRANPVILFLHGGPGDALSPIADSMFAGWDKDFTLVQWDQRGAGRTYSTNGEQIEPTMTMERMAQDGIDVAEYLATHLGKKKIILVGMSWGSMLGIPMAHARPDLFQVYVGIGQFVNWRRNVVASYVRVLELARTAGDKPSVDALTALGPPPWNTLHKWPVFRKIENAYQAKRVTVPPAPQALSPAYASAQEQKQYEAADDFSFVHFWGMTMSGPETSVDLPAVGTEFAIPILVVQGEEDLKAIPALAKDYVDSIKAPRKRFVLIPGAGHDPSVAEIAAAHNLLLEQATPSSAN